MVFAGVWLYLCYFTVIVCIYINNEKCYFNPILGDYIVSATDDLGDLKASILPDLPFTTENILPFTLPSTGSIPAGGVSPTMFLGAFQIIQMPINGGIPSLPGGFPAELPGAASGGIPGLPNIVGKK